MGLRILSGSSRWKMWLHQAIAPSVFIPPPHWAGHGILEIGCFQDSRLEVFFPTWKFSTCSLLLSTALLCSHLFFKPQPSTYLVFSTFVLTFTFFWLDQIFATSFLTANCILSSSWSLSLSRTVHWSLTFQKYKSLHSASPPVKSCAKAVGAFQLLIFFLVRKLNGLSLKTIYAC